MNRVGFRKEDNFDTMKQRSGIFVKPTVEEVRAKRQRIMESAAVGLAGFRRMNERLTEIKADRMMEC